MEEYIRIFWLDTSALVKLFMDERGSKELKAEVSGKDWIFCYTTDYCRYEYFNVLKRKLITEKKRKSMTERSNALKDYFKYIIILNTLVKTEQIKIDDADHDTTIIWSDTIKLANKYEIDFTDAIQFVLLKTGSISIFKGGKSEAILVTSDAGMIKAAKGESIQFWNPENGLFAG
jgi:predicted nucleic acid-binding protein